MTVLHDLRAHARGLGAAGAINFLQLALGVANGIVLARSLSPERRGELAAILLWSGLVTTVAEGGLGFAISYFSGCHPASRRQLWRIAVVGGLSAGTLIAVVTWAVMPSRIVPDTRALAIGLASVPVSLIAGHQAYLLLGLGDLAAFNVIRLVATVLYTGLTAIIAISGTAWPISFLVAYLLGQLASFAFGAMKVRAALSNASGGDALRLPDVVVYGVKAWTGSIFAQLSLRIDQLALSFLGRASELGLYVIAYTAASIALPIYHAMSAHLAAAGADAPAVDLSPVRRTIAQSHLRMTILVATVASVLTGAAMFVVVPLAFGGDYSGAVVAATILCGAVGVSGLNIVFGAVHRLLGRPGAPALAEAAAALLGIALVPSLYYQWGINGVAFGALAAMAGGCVAHLILFLRFRVERRIPVSA